MYKFPHTQLKETDSLPRPVVLIKGTDAEDLMNLVNKNEEATVVIETKVEPKWVSIDGGGGGRFAEIRLDVF